MSDEHAHPGIEDEDLPEDLQPTDDNPLAKPLPTRTTRSRPRSSTCTAARRRRRVGRATTRRRPTTPTTDGVPSRALSVLPPSGRRVTSRDRYGTDVLATDWRAPKRGRAVEAPAELGAVVEEVTTDWCGEIVAVDRDLHTLTLEDRRGKRRTFPLGPGLPARGPAGDPGRAARAAALRRSRRVRRPARSPCHGAKARVARASRIFVEGRHDAELVEKVWGDDLRIEGVVVEYLGGVDDLADHLRDFRPGPERKVGVLVDHLVRGLQGEPDRPGHREVAGRQARADRRSPVHRHLGRGEARAARPAALARRARAPSSGRRASASSSAGRTATRPTPPAPGSTSSAGSRRTTTSTRPCWAGSRSSSTSSATA